MLIQVTRCYGNEEHQPSPAAGRTYLLPLRLHGNKRGLVAHLASAPLLRLHRDVGQDRLLAQRRRWRGGHHPVSEVSLLLLWEYEPT